LTVLVRVIRPGLGNRSLPGLFDQLSGELAAVDALQCWACVEQPEDVGYRQAVSKLHPLKEEFVRSCGHVMVRASFGVARLAPVPVDELWAGVKGEVQVNLVDDNYLGRSTTTILAGRG
jgi:hypothetical protein